VEQDKTTKPSWNYDLEQRRYETAGKEHVDSAEDDQVLEVRY
jgi:hypothetical protein